VEEVYKIMFIDGLDSMYGYVKSRILTMNPQRVVKGMLNAQDWPSKNIEYDAFYMLDLGETAIGKQGYSASTPIKFHAVQWVWINKGTDVAPTVRQANRGDKYRTMQQMKGELTFGLYPGFAQKFSWALVGSVFTPTALNPVEYITWTPVQFHEKWSQQGGAGVGYGAGYTSLTDMLDTIVA
jgi:hypothetical protein